MQNNLHFYLNKPADTYIHINKYICILIDIYIVLECHEDFYTIMYIHNKQEDAIDILKLFIVLV